jgi:hypothetical protein
MKKLSLTICGLFLVGMAATLFAETPTKPFAVNITDIRIVDLPQSGNIITVEVDYTAHIEGVVMLRVNQPRYMDLTEGTLERIVHVSTGQEKTELFRFDGLLVSISGNIIGCSIFLENRQMWNNIPDIFFELTNIKTIK